MNNINRAPEYSSNFKNVSISNNVTRIPSHIRKLCERLLKASSLPESNKVLVLTSNLLSNDPALRDLYSKFDWSEDLKTFKNAVNVDMFIDELERVYQFKRSELEKESSEKESAMELSQSHLNQAASQSFGQKDDDPFLIKRPIANRNMVDRRSLENSGFVLDNNFDNFLSNSAKAQFKFGEIVLVCITFLGLRVRRCK